MTEAADRWNWIGEAVALAAHDAMLAVASGIMAEDDLAAWFRARIRAL